MVLTNTKVCVIKAINHSMSIALNVVVYKLIENIYMFVDMSLLY